MTNKPSHAPTPSTAIAAIAPAKLMINNVKSTATTVSILNGYTYKKTQ